MILKKSTLVAHSINLDSQRQGSVQQRVELASYGARMAWSERPGTPMVQRLQHRCRDIFPQWLPNLVNIQKTMERFHHFQWENPLFLWSFSIAMLVCQRVPSGDLLQFAMVITMAHRQK